MMGFRLLFAPTPPAAFPFDRLHRRQLSYRPGTGSQKYPAAALWWQGNRRFSDGRTETIRLGRGSG